MLAGIKGPIWIIGGAQQALTRLWVSVYMDVGREGHTKDANF